MEHEETQKTKQNRGIGLTEILISVLVAAIFGAAALFGLNYFSEGLGTVGLLAVAQVVVYGAALVGIGVAVFARRLSFASLGLLSTTWRWILIGVGIAFLSRFLTIVIVPIYILITGDDTNPQQGLFEDFLAGSTFQIALFAVAIALLAPFAEELFFRGMIFGWLRKWGFWLAALISAGLFGAAHGLNFVFPASFALGFLNAYAYEKSGSIWPAIVSHITFNGTSLAALLALSQMDVPGL